MLNKTQSFFILTALSFSSLVMANNTGKDIALKGNNKGATACVACHGTQGDGMAASGFPRLAGLNQAYLEKQLHDLASGKRNSGIMSPIASALTDSEIESIASYFAKMPVPLHKASEPLSINLSREGKKLAEKGNWDKDIPACFSCHGDNARGIGEHFPALTGQSENYLTQQLQAWKTGQRNNDPNQLMKGIAQRLSNHEIKAVTAYLASIPPSDKK